MSLTLNDEQEKALREWYYRNTTDGCEWSDGAVGRAGRGLQNAIAPLMKPWTIQAWELGWLLKGPDGSILVQARDGYRNIAAKDNIVRRICDLLNESEGRQ